MTAVIRAWNVPFKGDAANILLETIPMYLEEGRRLHANIVNSSGSREKNHYGANMSA
jgi:hypothetical protein